LLQKFILSASERQKLLLKIISFVLICVATFGFMLCITAFIIVRVDTPEYVLIPLTTGLLTFSSFINSFFLAKIFKENGIIIGCTVSGIYVCFIIISAVLYGTFSLSEILVTKVSAIIIAGVLGGILGVNS